MLTNLIASSIIWDNSILLHGKCENKEGNAIQLPKNIENTNEDIKLDDIDRFHRV